MITLAIVGIVAAMTIPTLMTKIEHRVLVSQFKKAYANATLAYKVLIEENGIEYKCYYDSGYKTTECEDFYKEYFAIQKTNSYCTYGSPNCSPIYKLRNEVIEKGGTRMGSSTCSFLKTTGGWYFRVYQLPNGVMYIRSNEGGNGYNFFALDINGKKGPNKWGYDIFYLTFYKDTTKDDAPVIISQYLCGIKEKGGYTFDEMLKEIKKY